MEIRYVVPVSAGKIAVFFRYMVILFWIILPGCMKMPGPFETLADFQQGFYKRKAPAAIPPGAELTLQKAVETALLNNPTNLAAAQAVNAARYGYYRALSAYAPEFNVNYSLGHTLSRGWNLKNPPVGVMKRNDHFAASGTVSASLLLFDGFARELETIIARQEYNKSAAAEKNVRRLLSRAAAFAYLDMYLAEEEIVIYGEDLDFQNAALRQEEERFRNGHVSKASVLNFRILAAKARSNISNARYRRQVAFHALSALMGYAPGVLPEDIKLQKISTSVPAQIYDEDFYLELAVMQRPDLQAEKITLEIAYRSKQKALADFFPEFRIFSEYSFDTYNARYGGWNVSRSHSLQGIFTYGLEGKWNIFRGFSTINNMRRQQALEKVALWGLNAKFLEVAAEVSDARSNCLNARYQIEVYQEMAQWVKEQRDLVFSEYCNGRETLTRLNETQATLTGARSCLAVSAIEFSKSAAQLAAAIGLPAFSSQ
ncbi:MAG: TolC family protein [Lentisphaeria bacterium]|nr:TolC family protein [Lentisphaeria bacterium]